ncbi:MAG: FTR1 family protein [Actinomycetaceae bacterium]|nr:FTR1 family protein [Actinomycetaceae bacterium]
MSHSHQRKSFFILVLMAAVTTLTGICLLLPAQAFAHESRATIGTEKDNFTPMPICEKGVHNADGTPRTYQDYALCMAGELDHSLEAYHKKDYDKAYEYINEAYFGWYENNLEPQSMRLAGNRKIKMERRFSVAKKELKDDPENCDLDKKLTELKIGLARDAMVLDGVLQDGAPESAGKALLEKNHVKEKVDQSRLNWVDFGTSLTLLLREGLEAMLVVVAIVLYLVKAEHKKLAKYVYWGAGAAVILSFLLAWLMKILVGGASQASELIEGITMFAAVAMLFYVSNWMLSKTSGKNWADYIQGMVKTSVSRGAAFALIFAAFLAVIREGAELVLFYTAAFSGEGHNPWWIGAGFAVGVIVLAIIFVIFRFGGARLPVRPIFFATSILLFIMCISFVGKGVQELREADVIQGVTNLPWMKYYMPELGIFPQAETLLPQMILLVASVWLIIAHWNNNRRYNKQVKADTENTKE